MGFFDNFGKKVTSTYKSATKASGKLFEEAKLKFLISDNESQMSDIFEIIGREYCEAYFKGELLDNAKFEEEYDNLKKMQLENDQAREKILLLKNIRKCANCGKEIDANHNFCQFCGMKQPEIPEEEIEVEAEVEEEEVKEEPKEVICKGCKAKLTTEDAYCPFCGIKVE